VGRFVAENGVENMHANACDVASMCSQDWRRGGPLEDEHARRAVWFQTGGSPRDTHGKRPRHPDVIPSEARAG
jgi:hypothetical protein